MLEEHHTYIDTLLAKHFAKENLSSNEQKQIDEWQKENEQEYARLKQLWIAKTAHTFRVDIDKAWKKVLAKKQQKKASRSIFGFTNSRLAIYAVAASLALLLGTFMWFYLSKSSYEEYYNANTVAATYTLPDNSTVTLNQNTRLRYYNKTKATRKTELLSGEVFFEVQPNKEKPFEIFTENAKIRVLGTSFNVKAAKENTIVSVKTGTVSLSKSDTESIKLTKGEQGVANHETLAKTELSNENYLAWKTRKLIFKNTSVYEAAKQLTDYFHVKISVPENCKCYFTTTFTTETLDEAMKEIQILTHIKYEINENEVVISCENCE